MKTFGRPAATRALIGAEPLSGGMDGEITSDELSALLEDGTDVRIVDIRPPASFRRAHIPDSENVPFGQLPDEIERFGDADRIVTVCPHGKASVQAAQLFASYEGTADAVVESLAEGLEAWDGPFDGDDVGATTEPATESKEPDAPF